MSAEDGNVPNYVALASEIVSAFVANNPVPVTDLPGLLGAVHATLSSLNGRASSEAAAPTPAVPIKRSVTPDYLVCLEDGKKFKSLKRHLRSRYNLSPDEYRARWNLSSDYPMVAPNYAAARSELARTMGLGQQRRKRPAGQDAALRGRRAAEG